MFKEHHGALSQCLWTSQGTLLKQILKLLSSNNLLQGTIEKFLLHFVDLSFIVPESSVQSLWAQCFALIPRLGGSGNQGAQHKTNWIELYSLVLGSLQRSVDSMFKHVDELKVLATPFSSEFYQNVCFLNSRFINH